MVGEVLGEAEMQFGAESPYTYIDDHQVIAPLKYRRPRLNPCLVATVAAAALLVCAGPGRVCTWGATLMATVMGGASHGHTARNESSVVHSFILLDSTGSMESLRDATVKGFDSYISEQKGVPGAMKLTLVTFNSCQPFELKLDAVDIHAVDSYKVLADYRPDCTTPLYDAMAQTIDHAARVAEGEKDVIVVVMTDGAENASKEQSRASVAAKVDEMKKRHGWSFVFLGANQDSFLTGGAMGVAKEATANWKATAQGASMGWNSLSSAYTSSRFARRSMPHSASLAQRSAAFKF